MQARAERRRPPREARAIDGPLGKCSRASAWARAGTARSRWSTARWRARGSHATLESWLATSRSGGWRAAGALLAAHHEAQLANLIEHVRDGLARHDAGEIDAFVLDAVMHRYQRAARELWKFCATSGEHAVTVAALLDQSVAAGDPPDWRELAKPRER